MGTSSDLLDPLDLYAIAGDDREATGADTYQVPAPEVLPMRSPEPRRDDLTAAALVPAPRSAPAVVVKENIPTAKDTDTATAQTIAKMCEYIKAGAADDWVRYWSDLACARYGLGDRSPHSLCWAVYWMVKHCVQFARDEPRLFRIGEPAALDMLIAPAVLVRMPQPREDCDGFTMLVCAMLTALGVPCCIVTIAADPADRSRWSHVFPMALLPDQPCPLDASHGLYPGWMVPRHHIFRWQTWDLDGRPSDVKPPAVRGLHGYVSRGRRMARTGMMGLGDDGTTIDLPSFGGDSSLAPSSLLDVGSVPLDTSGPSFSLPSVSNPIDWGSIINNAISGASKVAQYAFLPSGSIVQTSPQGTYVATGGANPANPAMLPFSMSGIASFLPWIIGGVVLFVVVRSMSEDK